MPDSNWYSVALRWVMVWSNWRNWCCSSTDVRVASLLSKWATWCTQLYASWIGCHKGAVCESPVAKRCFSLTRGLGSAPFSLIVPHSAQRRFNCSCNFNPGVSMGGQPSWIRALAHCMLGLTHFTNRPLCGATILILWYVWENYWCVSYITTHLSPIQSFWLCKVGSWEVTHQTCLFSVRWWPVSMRSS